MHELIDNTSIHLLALVADSKGQTSGFGFINWQALSSFHIFLLIGTAVLAVALMILTLTKWGHARPIWKCAILSLGAHVLLMTYAYGTHLILKVPGPNDDPQVKIQIIQDSDSEVPGRAETVSEDEPEDKPWDQIESAMPAPALTSSEQNSDQAPLPELLSSTKLDIPSELANAFEPRPNDSELTPFQPKIDQPERLLPVADRTPEPFQLPDLSDEIDFNAQIDTQFAQHVPALEKIEPIEPIETVEKVAPEQESRKLESPTEPTLTDSTASELDQEQDATQEEPTIPTPGIDTNVLSEIDEVPKK